MTRYTTLHKYYCVILFSIFQIFLFSQENYEPGYILTKSNDTLSGFIDYRDWNQGPFIIDFKNDRSAPSTRLSPPLINGFGVFDEKYLTGFVWLDKSPHESATLNRTSERQVVREQIFMQVIVESTDGLNLYLHVDENGKEHFLCNFRDSIVELRLIEYINVTESTIVSIREWVLRLIEITAECPEVINQTSSLSLTISSLTDFILKYNECMNYRVIYVYEEPASNFAFGLLAGGSLARVNYQVELEGPYYAEAEYPLSPGFTAGIFFDFDLPQRRQTWWLCNELHLHYFNSTGTYNGMLGLVAQHAEIDFRQLDLKLTTTIKVQANTRIMKPYFKFGITNSFARISTNKTEMINENTFSGEVDTVYYEGDVEKNIYHYGATVACGINIWDRVYLQFSYERGFHISDYINIYSSEDDFYATLYFRIR